LSDSLASFLVGEFFSQARRSARSCIAIWERFQNFFSSRVQNKISFRRQFAALFCCYLAIPRQSNALGTAALWTRCGSVNDDQGDD
jgi:predicted transcriptional regulator